MSRVAHRPSVKARAVDAGTSNGRAPRVSFRRQKRVTEGWSDRGNWQKQDESTDRLHNLGSSQNYNINVDHGQSSQYLDSLFTGELLGTKADIADGSLRYDEFRKYNNIQGDYYIAPRFLWRVAMFMAKNYLVSAMPGVNIPLIMGIWGPKGTGKTFQTELSFKKMGVEPIIMSAGELESEVAGSPGRLIRQRYRRAAEVSKVNGRMSCLMINDIDAGIGRFQDTQCTVNNQIVVSTLMNICDDPTRVSIGGTWRAGDVVRRTPIIVTGNDFSTLFAPLIRDGRMDKFYWEPEFDEKVQMVYQMYKDDALTMAEVSSLIERFRHQSLDFFGALRASTYDKQILDWVRKDVVGAESLNDTSNMAALGPRLLKGQDLPKFEPVELTLATLVEEGERLEYEQQMVKSMRLSDEYLRKQYGTGSMIGFG